MHKKMLTKSKIVNGGDVFKISFKKTSRADCGRNSCDCLEKISVLLSMYRFLLFVCYFLFLGAFWQSQVILKKSRRCRSCRKKRSKASKKSVYMSGRRTEKSNVEDDESITFADSCFTKSSNTSINEDTSEFDSSGDSVGENIHFITYLEEQDHEGFQDDDYTDIFRYNNSMAAITQVAEEPEDLEAFLDQHEIDWDAPLPVSVEEESASLNDSFCAYEGTYVDDDYSAVLDAVSQPEFEIPDAGELLEDSYFPESLDIVKNMEVYTKEATWSDVICDEQRIIEKYGHKKFLDVESSAVPVYDEDVLAAILGLQKGYTTHNTNPLDDLVKSNDQYQQTQYRKATGKVTERFISQMPITDKDKASMLISLSV